MGQLVQVRCARCLHEATHLPGWRCAWHVPLTADNEPPPPITASTPWRAAKATQKPVPHPQRPETPEKSFLDQSSPPSIVSAPTTSSAVSVPRGSQCSLCSCCARNGNRSQVGTPYPGPVLPAVKVKRQSQKLFVPVSVQVQVHWQWTCQCSEKPLGRKTLIQPVMGVLPGAET